VRSFLSHEKLPPVEEVRKRKEYCILIVKDGKTKLYSGEEGRRIASAELVEEKVVEVRELRGTPASLGLVRGPVRVVHTVGDLERVEEGDVLVAPQTNQNYIPAMRRAIAIVTDEGGITCHAAIVSRELGVPCVIGVKTATKILVDGEIVEVDATNGIVKRLTRS